MAMRSFSTECITNYNLVYVVAIKHSIAINAHYIRQCGEKRQFFPILVSYVLHCYQSSLHWSAAV